jgi:hypothetical protein
VKPHLYLREGVWWCDGKGLAGARGTRVSIPLSRPTFPEACHLAMLAAIHSGVWRA